MRATVQRDGNGVLDITACPVRVGKAGMPITSTRSGSQVYRFEDFFRKLLNYSNEEINILTEKVNEFLITAYKCIEDSYGTFGEIGIDFAIDKNKNIWFIECNAKPGKDTVYLSYDEDTVKKAFLNPLEYSKYLCGF
jgi:D-alanine-D-alanine ligase-like ATP-grasp enzyme